MRLLFSAALAAMTLAPTPQPAGLLAEEPTFAGVRVFYGPGDGFGAVDGRLINDARRSIDMAAYVLTDRSLTTALGRAAMRPCAASRCGSISTARKWGVARP